MSNAQASSRGILDGVTVLVADDEELMREIVSIMIEESGGTVILAEDGAEAVEKFKENKDKISCIMLDFSMPRMNGYEAYTAIRAIDPKVEAVMVSGLKVTSEVEKLQSEGILQFVPKPFHEDELLQALRKATDRRKG